MPIAALPSYAIVVGTIAGTGFVGGVAGYAIAAIIQYLAPDYGPDDPEELPDRWRRKGVQWAGFAAATFWVFRWLGID